jgi:hypothetical protein
MTISSAIDQLKFYKIHLYGCPFEKYLLKIINRMNCFLSFCFIQSNPASYLEGEKHYRLRTETNTIFDQLGGGVF